MFAIPEPLSIAATNDLKGWAHRVEKSSDKTFGKGRFGKIKTDEDVAKLEQMLRSAQPKDVDKARRLFAEEEALDSLTAAKGLQTRSLCEAWSQGLGNGRQWIFCGHRQLSETLRARIQSQAQCGISKFSGLLQCLGRRDQESRGDYSGSCA